MPNNDVINLHSADKYTQVRYVPKQMSFINSKGVHQVSPDKTSTASRYKNISGSEVVFPSGGSFSFRHTCVGLVKLQSLSNLFISFDGSKAWSV